MDIDRGLQWAVGCAAGLAIVAMAGCGPSIGSSPNTIQTAVSASLPSGYGLYVPRRQHSGVFVKTTGGIKYFDEKGYVHSVYQDENAERTHYVAWDNGRSWLIFLNPDGTFPTLERGRRRNLREATRALHASRRISADQIESCVAAARESSAIGGAFRISGDFEIDEARVYRGPRLPVEVQAPVHVGRNSEDRAPHQLVCAFDIVDGAPVFAAARLHRP